VVEKVDDESLPESMTVSTSGLFAPGGLGPRLLVLAAGTRAAHALPREGSVVIGRADDAEIRVDDPSLSRRHARLKIGTVYAIEDLGSRNGTHIGGRAVEEGQTAEVTPGEPFGLGKVVCILEVPARAAPRTAKKPPPAASKKLPALISLVAGSDISAVIAGETGVGKEVTARAIHDTSPRSAKPFLGINCAALPENLLESELFGYERGAFSGAVQPKPGLFESADGGTVFLDEIADMSLVVQAKLLRVIEERQVTRLGALKPRSIDVRFLSASHRTLDAEVEAGRFRQDLFFRLNGITLHIPPLRDRVEEMEPLARRFLEEASRRVRRDPPTLSPAALEALRAHRWPGNVRELKNTIERGLLLCAGSAIVEPEHLFETPTEAPRATKATFASAPPPHARDAERERILRALQEAAGNQTRAAELLGISRRTLVNRIIELGIPRPRKG
jgi:two-component system, NtrC family, response regulator AtoC